MAKLQLTYRDGSSTTFALGAFAQIAAKRRYGLEVMKTEDPEPILFAAFVETVGARAARPEEFDQWLESVETWSLAPEADSADPPPAESSESSPDSPPTSDSTLGL